MWRSCRFYSQEVSEHYGNHKGNVQKWQKPGSIWIQWRGFSEFTEKVIWVRYSQICSKDKRCLTIDGLAHSTINLNLLFHFFLP